MKIDKQIKQLAQMVNEAEGYHAGRQMPGQLLAFKHPKLGDIVGRLLTTFVN